MNGKNKRCGLSARRQYRLQMRHTSEAAAGVQARVVNTGGTGRKGCTFSVPKSISLLCAIHEDKELVEAFRSAVTEITRDIT
jgi:TrwC relaxase